MKVNGSHLKSSGGIGRRGGASEAERVSATLEVERRAEADIVGDEREVEREHTETDDGRREKIIKS